MDIDLLDRRGRLVRLVAAGVIGLVSTLVIMRLIFSVAASPDADALSQISPILMGIAMFTLISSGVFSGLAALKKRSRRV